MKKPLCVLLFVWILFFSLLIVFVPVPVLSADEANTEKSPMVKSTGNSKLKDILSKAVNEAIRSGFSGAGAGKSFALPFQL